MKYRGIIFDFNGVLWWDKHLQERSWRKFTDQWLGISLTSEVMDIHVHGRHIQHTLEYLAGSRLNHETIDQLSDQKETIYRELCLAQEDGFELSPGAKELLDNLASCGVPRTIATASGKENLDFFFEHLNLSRWFERQCIVYDDGTRPGKPDPDIYIQAAQVLGLYPTDCVVVEDSLSGLQAAFAAGIGYIIALGTTEDFIRKKDGIDQVIDNLAQVHWRRLFL